MRGGRFTTRERILALLAGALAVIVLVLVGLTAFHRPSRPAAGPARQAATPHTSATPTRSASAGPAALKAEYAVRNRWPGGFNAELVVTNLGSAPVEGWAVRLGLPADVKVYRAWAADMARVPGAVVLESQPWNTYLAPGGTVHFGFEATGSPARPTACTVNGSPC